MEASHFAFASFISGLFCRASFISDSSVVTSLAKDTLVSSTRIKASPLISFMFSLPFTVFIVVRVYLWLEKSVFVLHRIPTATRDRGVLRGRFYHRIRERFLRKSSGGLSFANLLSTIEG